MLRNVPSRLALSVLLLLTGLSGFGDTKRAVASGAVTLTLAANSATASGITPGGRAVFFASGLQHNGYDTSFVRIATIVSDDANSGTVTLTLTDPISATTIWAVVDLTDGRYAVASPAGYTTRTVDLPRNVLRRVSGRTGVVRFGFDHPALDLLYVQPGMGAWAWYAMDGRKLDHDGANGVTLIDAADGIPLGDTSGNATELEVGGTLVAVDWYNMEYAVLRLDEATVGAAQ